VPATRQSGLPFRDKRRIVGDLSGEIEGAAVNDRAGEPAFVLQTADGHGGRSK